MIMREAVTIQLGHYSNFVGTQWWNLQESGFSYDPKHPSEFNTDILFREGRTVKGDITYTPRLICLDLKGSLGSLRRYGTLYENLHTSRPKWPAKIQIHKEAPAHKNEFRQDLDKQDEMFAGSEVPEDEDKDIDACMDDESGTNESTSALEDLSSKEYNLKDDDVKVWSDILRVHFHPRSVLLVEEYSHESETDRFMLFPQGIESWKKELEDDFTDAVRFYAEECDSLGVFYCLSNVQDGFGGVTEQVLLHLDDEYSGKMPVVFPCISGLPKTNESYLDAVNQLLCVSRLCCANESVIISPLSVFSSWSHSEPVSWPAISYQDCSSYHSSGLLALSLETLTSAFRLKYGSCQIDDVVHRLTYGGRKCANVGSAFSSFQEPNYCVQSLCPGIPSDSKCDTVMSVLRGKQPPITKISGAVSNELLASNQVSITEGCKLNAPFPLIYENQENPLTLSSWSSGPGVGGSLLELYRRVNKLKPFKLHTFMEAGMEKDEINESVHKIQEIAHNYTNC